MSTVFNLQVLSSDCFISGTVRMPAIKEVGMHGARSLLLYCWQGPVNTAAVMFMLPDHMLQFLHWFGLFFYDKTSY